jgi:hypothetical protein
VSGNRLHNRGFFTAGRKVVLLLIVFSALIVRAGTSPLAATSVREYELKAAYIYNFAKFTRWESAGAAGIPNPLIIGVLGDERLADSLAALTRGRNVGGSPVIVKSLAPDEIPPEASIVYVAPSQDAALGNLAPTLFRAGRLTIGESDRFRDSGGIIFLVVQDARLQFEIDNARAQRAGLALSSQLLALARKVY